MDATVPALRPGGTKRIAAWAAMVLFVVLALAAAFGLILAPIDPADVVGDYSCVHSYGTETLSLKPDGTYVQGLPSIPGYPSSSSGTWTFRSGELWLRDAIVVDGAFGRPRAEVWRASWMLPVRRALITRSIYFPINPDMPEAFRRVQ